MISTFFEKIAIAVVTLATSLGFVSAPPPPPAEIIVAGGPVSFATLSPFRFNGSGDLVVQRSTSTPVILGAGASTTASHLETPSLTITNLTSEDCIGTDANGVVQSGTCTGAGGDGSISTSTAVTAGYFPKWDTASTVSGTSTIFSDSGNIGINTISPSTSLHVIGTGRFSNNLTLDSGLIISGDTINDFNGTGLTVSGNTLNVSGLTTSEFATTSISQWNNDAGYTTSSHAAVTLAGEDYLSLATQEITAIAINPDNLASADFGDFTCNGTTCTLDATYLTAAVESANSITGAVTFAGTANRITVSSSSQTITFTAPQDLHTSSAFTVATLDTGQGANELYDMDQNVLTTSDPTFNSLTLTTALSETNGGTGFSTYATGDLIYASAANTLSKLANPGGGTKFLFINAGTVNWSALATTDIASGVFTVARGGTGTSTLPDNGVLVGSGTGAITSLGVGTNGQLLIGSSGADPVFATLNCNANLTCTTGAGTLEINLDNELRTDSIPDTDHTANGPTTNSKNAGYSSAIGDLVFLGTNGKWLEADASTSTLASGMLSIALEATTDGNAMLVANPGSYVRDDSWSWNTGAILYASETLGAISESVPTSTDSVVRVVGFAYTTTTIYFQPESGYITIE